MEDNNSMNDHDNKWKAAKEFLGVPLEELLAGKCTGRKGILQQRNGDDWITVAVASSGGAKVFECEHEALDAVRDIMTAQLLLSKQGVVKVDDMPKPWDFRYTFVDQEPPEVEVTDTSAANEVLSGLMKGAQQ